MDSLKLDSDNADSLGYRMMRISSIVILTFSTGMPSRFLKEKTDMTTHLESQGGATSRSGGNGTPNTANVGHAGSSPVSLTITL
jgi:hypothetical protein